MKTQNSFFIGSSQVTIAGGFIPEGKEYTLLKNTIENNPDKSGSFKMQFSSKYSRQSFLLTVKYSKN